METQEYLNKFYDEHRNMPCENYDSCVIADVFEDGIREGYSRYHNQNKWHEIKNPNDLPKSNETTRLLGCDRNHITIEVYWYKGHWYDYFYEGKLHEQNDLKNGEINIIDDDIIAWMEIPEFR